MCRTKASTKPGPRATPGPNEASVIVYNGYHSYELPVVERRATRLRAWTTETRVVELSSAYAILVRKHGRQHRLSAFYNGE